MEDEAYAVEKVVLLEDGDRLLIPVRPATVGVLGSVYNQATFVYKPEKGLGDYLEQAGGPTRSADKSHIYVVRADGSVDGKARASIFGRSERMWPGDTVIAPENLDRFVLSKSLRDWTQIFSQFALGVAALKVLRDF